MKILLTSLLLLLFSRSASVEIPRLDISKHGTNFSIVISPNKESIVFTIALERKGKDGWAELDSDIRRPYASLPIISPLEAGKKFECKFVFDGTKSYKARKNVVYRFALKYGRSISDFDKVVYSEEFKML